MENGTLTPAEANFLNAAVPFVHQFISVPDPDIGLLSERFHGDRELAAILSAIQTRMDRDTFTLALVEQVYATGPTSCGTSSASSRRASIPWSAIPTRSRVPAHG